MSKSASETAWSEWRPLDEASPMAAASLAETLDGGQAFRWNLTPEGDWLGVWGKNVCRLRSRDGNALQWSAPAGIEDRVAAALPAYLGSSAEVAVLRDQLPWRSDSHLHRCVDAFPELRILRQPFGETLLAFLCSATKQIVQIKQMCTNLAQAFGETVVPGFYALPNWIALAHAPEEGLRSCGLGFRARYIKATALVLAEDPTFLSRVPFLPYAEAKVELMRLPGVGEKVADCVLLFGATKMEAFPVDVWILRVMETRYGLHGWSNAQIAQFGRVHFGPLAGFAQQFLFAAERRKALG